MMPLKPESFMSKLHVSPAGANRAATVRERVACEHDLLCHDFSRTTGDREMDSEGAPFAGAAHAVHLAAMGRHDVLHKAEAKANALDLS